MANEFRTTGWDMFAERLIASLMLICSISGCRTPASQIAPIAQPMAEVATPAGPIHIELEIADTPDKRTRGLMERRSLGVNSGMIFVFPNEEPLSFWMKNTYIPLDMIFVNREHSIVGIVANAEPLTLSSRSVATPAQYVIEVNGGFCETHQISQGQRVILHDVADVQE